MKKFVNEMKLYVSKDPIVKISNIQVGKKYFNKVIPQEYIFTEPQPNMCVMEEEMFQDSIVEKNDINGFYIVSTMKEITPEDITDDGIDTISWTSFTFAYKLEKEAVIVNSYDSEELGMPGDYVVCKSKIVNGEILPDDNVGYCIVPKDLIENSYDPYTRKEDLK